jgi:hypothetical protein
LWSCKSCILLPGINLGGLQENPRPSNNRSPIQLFLSQDPVRVFIQIARVKDKMIQSAVLSDRLLWWFGLIMTACRRTT